MTLHSDFLLIYLSLSLLRHSWKSIWIFRKGISHRNSWRRKWKAISRPALSVIKQEKMLWAQRNASEILVLCKHRCFRKHQIYDSKHTEPQTLNTVDRSGSKIWLDESSELKPFVLHDHGCKVNVAVGFWIIAENTLCDQQILKCFFNMVIYTTQMYCKVVQNEEVYKYCAYVWKAAHYIIA